MAGDLETLGSCPSDGNSAWADLRSISVSVQTLRRRESRDRVVCVRTDAGICRRRRCHCDHHGRCARHALECADLPGTPRTAGVVDRPDRCATGVLVDRRDPGDIGLGMPMGPVLPPSSQASLCHRSPSCWSSPRSVRCRQTSTRRLGSRFRRRHGSTRYSFLCCEHRSPADLSSRSFSSWVNRSCLFCSGSER